MSIEQEQRSWWLGKPKASIIEPGSEILVKTDTDHYIKLVVHTPNLVEWEYVGHSKQPTHVIYMGFINNYRGVLTSYDSSFGAQRKFRHIQDSPSEDKKWEAREIELLRKRGINV